MSATPDFNSEYISCFEMYRDQAARMLPYEFYSCVTSAGVSRYFATCLLRDCYGMNLLQCTQIVDLRRSRSSSPSMCNEPRADFDGLCFHLTPILEQLESECDVVQIATRNGKGWGYVSLVNQLPELASWNFANLPDCVSISNTHPMISCVECWSNIAENDRFLANWD